MRRSLMSARIWRELAGTPYRQIAPGSRFRAHHSARTLEIDLVDLDHNDRARRLAVDAEGLTQSRIDRHRRIAVYAYVEPWIRGSGTKARRAGRARCCVANRPGCCRGDPASSAWCRYGCGRHRPVRREASSLSPSAAGGQRHEGRCFDQGAVLRRDAVRDLDGPQLCWGCHRYLRAAQC